MLNNYKVSACTGAESLLELFFSCHSIHLYGAFIQVFILKDTQGFAKIAAKRRGVDQSGSPDAALGKNAADTKNYCVFTHNQLIDGKTVKK